MESESPIEARVKLEILFKEIDIIENSIRKMDELSHNLKNWTIVTWGGSVGLLLQNPKLHLFVATAAIIPILFMFVDAHWRRLQRSFVYRFVQITEFINGDRFAAFIKSGDQGGFPLLDPRGWKTRDIDSETEYKKFTGMRKVLNFRSIAWFYLALAFVSIALGFFLQWLSL